VVQDQVFSLIYSEFIEELPHNLTTDPDEPVPVFPFAYDWRQQLEPVQIRLAWSSHFLGKKQGHLGGRPGPGISMADWDPPIPKGQLT